MSPITLVILFFVAGVVLLLAEIVLPTHGILGVVGVVALLVGVGVCFWINQYAGLVAAVVLMLLTPLAATLWVRVWPKTFAGKRLILGPTAASEAQLPAASVAVGQLGVVVTELRPGGICEFGMTRVEARAERGTIPAGRHVEVVALSDGRRPLVRAV